MIRPMRALHTTSRRRRRIPAALLLASLALAGCQRAPEASRAAEGDPGVQLRIGEGERLLERIRTRRLRGQDVLADCRLAYALFARPLAQLEGERPRRVARQLTRVCRTAREHSALR